MATLSSFKSGVITAVGGGGGAGVTTYDSANVLPLKGNTAGDQAFVTATDRLYIWDGSGWYNIALINTNPSFDSNGSPDASYSLDSAGSSVSITLAATDPEGIPITYTTVKDSADDFVSILQTTTTNTGDTFVISAKSLDSIISNGYDSDFVGTFDITFRASDGVNLATALSEFTVTFTTTIQDSKYTTLLLKSVGANNGTNSSFTDASTNSHTITANGDVHAGTFSPYAREDGAWATVFDGSNDLLTWPSSSAFNLGSTYTIEFWLYLESYDVSEFTRFLMFGVNNTFEGLYCGISTSGKLQVGIPKASTSITSTSTVSTHTWTHFAIVRNSATSTSKIYIDGVEDASVSETTVQTSGDVGLRIGYDNVATVAGQLNGYLSNLRLTKSAVYTSAFTPPTEPLTAIANTVFLTCQSNRFVDNSSSNLTITSVTGDAKPSLFTPFDHVEYSSSSNGGSVYFDGTGDYLTVPHDTSLDLSSGDFTIEGWFYPLDTATSTILNKDGQFGVAYTAYAVQFANDSKVKAFVGNATTLSGTPIQTLTSSSSYTTNRWYHFAFVKNSTTLTLYLNGKQEVTATQTQTIVSDGDPLYIGYENGQSDYANGYISDIRIIKGTALYTSAFTPPTEPLTAITNTSLLINGTDGSIIDYSGSSNVAVTASDDVVSSTAVTKYGSSSIEFDGTGYATVNVQPFGTGDFTVEFWCYASAYSSYQMGYDNRVSSATGIGIYLGTSGQLQLANNTNIVVSSAGSLPTNQWNHVAVTRESGTIYFYINGTKSGSTYSDTRDYTGTEAVIGGNSSNQNFTGYMEDIRVTQGLARYTASFTPPTAGLRG